MPAASRASGHFSLLFSAQPHLESMAKRGEGGCLQLQLIGQRYHFLWFLESPGTASAFLEFHGKGALLPKELWVVPSPEAVLTGTIYPEGNHISLVGVLWSKV